jgi:hypothetical protein
MGVQDNRFSDGHTILHLHLLIFEDVGEMGLYRLCWEGRATLHIYQVSIRE